MCGSLGGRFGILGNHSRMGFRVIFIFLGGVFGDFGLPRGPQKRQGGKSNQKVVRGSVVGLSRTPLNGFGSRWGPFWGITNRLKIRLEKCSAEATRGCG